jgi:hypothetical protein
MFQNNVAAQAILAGDRQCRLRADNDLSKLARRSRRHRVARPERVQPALLRPCVNEVLS